MRSPWDNREWSRVLVLGLGRSGQAAMRFLASRGVAIVAVDKRQDVGDMDLGGAAVEWLLGDDDIGLPPAVDAVVLSPGVPSRRRLVREARAAGLPILSEVELAFPFLSGTVVAVTGSNGKSTTASMTAAILESAGRPTELCGNIGAPLCSKIDGLEDRIFVVELSSFQLEEVLLFKADAAALLNLSPDHLDRYDGFEDYMAAKRRIFERQTRDSVAVLNADDDVVARVGPTLDARVRYFSRRGPVGDGCWLSGSRVVERSAETLDRPLFDVEDLSVRGVHNLENAMAAALLARSCGVEVEPIRDALCSFSGLPHRLQEVRRRAGVSWYDDSKGTNVGATEKSLEGFADGSVHLILGGRGKSTDASALEDAVRRKARHLYLIGEMAATFERSLGSLVETENVGTLERAISRAAVEARPGEVVLLSPACASFDQFEDFADRGRCFQALVRALNGESGGQEAGI